MRTFDSGATRDADDDKLDFDGFLSEEVIECFARYMHKHRVQSDGQLRDSENWKKGIPRKAYMKSMWRHFMDVWKLHRGKPGIDAGTIEEALCALLFNVMGYLHEVREGRDLGTEPKRVDVHASSLTKTRRRMTAKG